MRGTAMRTAALLGALALLAGCAADRYDASSLQARVAELAQEHQADQIVALDLHFSDGKGAVTMTGPGGPVGKVLESGDDRFVGPVALGAAAGIPIADYPYAAAVERAGQKDAGCAGDKNEPLTLNTAVTPAGAVAMSVECRQGSGRAWLGEAELKNLTDPFAEATLAQVLTEAEQVVGPELVELTATGAGGFLGADGVSVSFIGTERELSGQPCRPMAIRSLDPAKGAYANITCDETATGEPFTAADFPAADMRSAFDFGVHALGLASADEIATARAYKMNGLRYLQLTGTAPGVITTVSLDEG